MACGSDPPGVRTWELTPQQAGRLASWGVTTAETREGKGREGKGREGKRGARKGMTRKGREGMGWEGMGWVGREGEVTRRKLHILEVIHCSSLFYYKRLGCSSEGSDHL